MQKFFKYNNDIKFNYVKGDLKMKRSLFRNNKGFSLIELLIVLAILAVIAAISVAAFGGVLGNSKEKADLSQANNIKKAVASYLAETDDVDLTAMGVTTVDALLVKLQQKFTITDSAGNTVNCGPYLESRHAGSEVATDYAPQASGNLGWTIAIHQTSRNVDVTPSTSASGNVDVSQTN